MRKFMLSVFALALVASPAFAGKYNKTVSVGDKAPDFAGVPATLKGQDTSLTLGDIKEDVVVVVFLNIGCPYVVAIEDRLNDFASEFEGKSVKLVGISIVGDEKAGLTPIKEWASEKGSQYLHGFDDSQATGKAYGASNTPQFFVLGKDRKIEYMGAYDDSPMNEAKAAKHYVKDAVNALLDGKSIEVTETKAVGCGVSYKK